jgi:hypothetical protein
MLTEWTTPFVAAKDDYVTWLKEQKYPSYETLLKKAIEIICQEDFLHGDEPDPSRIHTIDDGDYQGTLVFVIGAKGYQPDNYWYTKVYYGSCSGCDALEDAWGYGDRHNYEGMYLIALHMLQGVKQMTGEDADGT